VRRILGISFATIMIVAVACDEFTDAGPSPDDGGAGEASSAVDASSDGDGGASDAGADAPSVPFCSTVDAAIPFCWSFDDASTSALYGTTFSAKGDPVSLTQLAKSAPNAMRAERDGPSGASMITMKAPLAKTNLACTISVFIESITDPTELLTFALGSRVAAFLVEPLEPNAVKTALLYDREGPKTVSGPNIPTNKWVAITLAGQRSGNGFLLATTTEFGDGGFVTADFADAGADIFAQTPNIEIGFYEQYGGTGAVRVDDILCDWN
jgi:hypothetical protein